MLSIRSSIAGGSFSDRLLVDKDAQGRSSLAYASDYKHIRSRDNLRLAYEQGRIRGVPVLGDLAELFARGVRHGT